MPQHDRLGTGQVEGVDRVPVAVRAREDDDADADGHQVDSLPLVAPTRDEAPARVSIA